jgi:hypothetical protein
MDARQEALFEELKSVVKVPVGENPLMNIHQAISLAQRHNILWRWAKDGIYYEFRWTPAHPPIRVPESQANVYVVKRIIQELSPKEEKPSKTGVSMAGVAPVGAEYDVLMTEGARKLLEGVELFEFADEIVGTGADGKVIVKDVKAFIKERE